MSFEDTEKGLYERAAWIEGLDGTVKCSFMAEPDDAANYNKATRKEFIIIAITMFALCIILLTVGILLDKTLLISISTAFLIFWIIFMAAIVRGIVKSKAINDQHIDEVKLAFNAYGVVFRVCNDIRTAVYAYEWQEFESISEYEKIIVGVRQNMAYIFPKRVFSEEEYNKFRRFSFAAIGKKCFYKNFKP